MTAANLLHPDEGTVVRVMIALVMLNCCHRGSSAFIPELSPKACPEGIGRSLPKGLDTSDHRLLSC